MAAKTKTTDPDLDLTDEQVAEILTSAQADVDTAEQAVTDAERALRGETPGGADITSARLAELRAEAEHAHMRVAAAERRVEEIHEKKRHAEQEAARAQIRAEAGDDLNSADHLVDRLDAFETALSDLCEGIAAHNGRIERWQRMMGAAGISAEPGEQAGPEGFTFDLSSGSVTIGEKVYRPLVGAHFVGATVHRVLRGYPRAFQMYDGRELVARDLIDPQPFSGPPLDLRARIRRDA